MLRLLAEWHSDFDPADLIVPTSYAYCVKHERVFRA
jgi:hypothetical protein